MTGKLFLNPEVFSGLGEDTFWAWIARELDAEVGVPKRIGARDLVLHYSTLGKPAHPSQTVTLLWELYPEMSLRLRTKYYRRTAKIRQSQLSRWATVPTTYSKAFYGAETRTLPIGVDSKLFSPGDKLAAKLELGLDPGRPAAFWSGANHPMKGPDLRDRFFDSHPEWQPVVVSKEAPVSQQDLALRMRASDGFLNTSRLVPLFMVDWECLAVGLKPIGAGGAEREFQDDLLDDPRGFVRRKGWFREDAISKWSDFIGECRLELRQ